MLSASLFIEISIYRKYEENILRVIINLLFKLKYEIKNINRSYYKYEIKEYKKKFYYFDDYRDILNNNFLYYYKRLSRRRISGKASYDSLFL